MGTDLHFQEDKIDMTPPDEAYGEKLLFLALALLFVALFKGPPGISYRFFPLTEVGMPLVAILPKGPKLPLPPKKDRHRTSLFRNPGKEMEFSFV
jgi:hypothetical protein